MLRVVSDNQVIDSKASKAQSDNFEPVAIVARIQQGDTSAETELINFYHTRLHFILTRKFPDANLCQDATQEAFIVVLNKIKNDEIKDPTKLTAFIRSTAINCALMMIRKNKKYVDASDSVALENLTDNQPAASDEIEQRQLATMVINVINELTNERDRKILTSFYISQLDKLQICQQLDITPNHFDKVIYRSKQRLKKQILSSSNTTFMTSISQWFRHNIKGTNHE
ncbi:MAG: RNA polymerase sigma factor [Psychrobium sp.]